MGDTKHQKRRIDRRRITRRHADANPSDNRLDSGRKRSLNWSAEEERRNGERRIAPNRRVGVERRQSVDANSSGK